MKTNRTLKVALAVLLTLLGPGSGLLVGSPLPKPVFSEGLTRRQAIILVNLPETLSVRTDLAAVTTTINAVDFELEDVDFGLWYNDGSKNQYVVQSMIRRGKGIWLCNLMRSQFSPGKWYGNMYNIHLTLWFASPDNKARVSRKLSTADGTFLEQLQALDAQVRPGELRLDLLGITLDP